MDTKNLPKLTKKQREFLEEYKKTGNGTAAAKKAYDTVDENTAAVIASENIRKPALKVYIDEWEEQAKKVVYQLSLSAENETVKLNAAKDILDRNIGKAKQHVDVMSDGKPIQVINYADIANDSE